MSLWSCSKRISKKMWDVLKRLTLTNCRSTSSALMTACSSGGCRALDRKGLIMPSLRIWRRQNNKSINGWFCKLAKWRPFKSEVNAKSLWRENTFSLLQNVNKVHIHTWPSGVAYWGRLGPEGSYQLHGEAGNSGWKIKWFAPFHLEVSENMGCD